MHFSIAIVLGLATISAALPQEKVWTAKELNDVEPVDAVPMSVMHQIKLESYEKQKLVGAYDEGRYQSQGAQKCDGGKAGEYKCQGIDLKGLITHGDMRSKNRIGNDVWGK